MEFYIELTTPYGIYEGEVLSGTEEQYNRILTLCENAFSEKTYCIHLKDGSYISLPNKLLQECIIQVRLPQDNSE